MKTFFSDLINSQNLSSKYCSNINETCPPMNQTHATPRPDNIMTSDTNNPSPRNKVWKYVAKLGSEELCTVRTLHFA